MTAQDYLKEHGINDETVKLFNITWDDDYLNIPIKDINGKVIFTKRRNLKFDPKNPESTKYKNEVGSTVSLFNIDRYKDAGVVVLAEGEMDAIRLTQENIPAVSVTAGAGTFPKELAELLITKKVYVCYDNDSGGVHGIRKVLELLPNADVITLPEQYKDTSEFFVDDHKRKDFIALVKKAVPANVWLIRHPQEEHTILTLNDLYAKEYPPENFIIDKFLPVSGITMFSGDAGVGKSFVALDIVKSIVTGKDFLGHFSVNMRDLSCLIIDKENGLKRMQKRLKGMEVPATDKVHLLKYPERFNLKNAEFMQYMADYIALNDIKLVVLDSFIDVLEGNENAAPDVSEVFNALRSIAPDICWVILHHESKPMPKFRRTASDRARGSSNIKAQLDYLFSLQRTKELRVIHIEQGKARDYELLPMFAVEFMTSPDGEMCGFDYLGEIKDDSSAVDEASSMITEYLKVTPNRSRQEIVDTAESEGIAESAVKRALAMLIEKKIVKAVPDPAKKSRKLFSVISDSDEEEFDLDETLSDLNRGLF